MSALRRLVPALVAAGVMAFTVVGCQWPDGTRYVDKVFTSYTERLGVDYRTTTNSTGATVTLKMDVYSPPTTDRARNRPAVIWGFGGAWIAGNRAQLRSYAQDSALRGYVGITIDYRTRPTPGPVLDMAGDAYDDTLAAVAFVKAHATEWGINPNAIVVGGYSAGGINAANVAYWPGERGPATSPVAGAVAIAGFTFGKPAAGEPPILMFHGDKDTIVPYGTGQSTCTAAKNAGAGCRLYTSAGAGHEIGATKSTEIMERTADWVFEVVLYPKGYRP
jgi:acetyl esterase/lipase